MHPKLRVFFILVNLILFICLNECSKQSEYKFLLNKSYELFSQQDIKKLLDQEDILKSSQFRLKCEFNVNSNKSETSYQIKWFKLDPYNLLILTDYTQHQLEQLNDPLMSDISIYPTENESLEPSSISSSLIFNYRNDKIAIQKIDGVYLCKLDYKVNQSSMIDSKPVFYQAVQQISINEIKSNEQKNVEQVKINLFQQTSTRLFIEINLEINCTKLFYTLSKSKNGQVQSKGKIPNLNPKSNKQYFLFETLEPLTNYTLEIYSDLNSKQLRKILIKNFTTLKLEKNNFSNFEDYEYDDDIDHDSIDTSLKRIINCDLNLKEKERSSFLKNSNSLFSKIKTTRKSQIITVNYSHRLLGTIINDHIKNSTKFFSLNQGENFQNFFELIIFRQNSPNFIINYDCLKQFKQLKSSQPLCVFNLESSIDTENSDDYDYDENFLSDEEDEHFNIHSSINLDHSILHLSSRCLKNSRSIRMSYGSSLGKNESSNLYQPLNTTINFIPITRSLEIAKKLDINNSAPKVKQLSSYKKDTGVSNFLSRQMANINNCYIINNREIQFQIESNKIADKIYNDQGKIPAQINRIQLSNKTLPFYYYIEIFSSELPVVMSDINNNGQNVKQRYRNILTNLPHLSKFKFKILNTTQVVKANLSFLKAKNKTVDTSNSTKLATSTISSSTQPIKLDRVIHIDEIENSNKIKSKKSITEEDDSNERSEESTVDAVLEEKSSLAERLASKNDPALNDFYVFKVKILSEDNTNINEFDVNVNCKKMNNSLTPNSYSQNDPSQNDANNSFFGLVMTVLCAVIIIIVGCLFCLIMKRKYGLNAPDYLINFKNNFFLKPSNIDSDQNLAKKSRTFQYHHQYQQQQYQLESSNKKTNLVMANQPANKQIVYQGKPSNFSYNYVRLLREKWQNRPSINSSMSNSSSSYNSKINIDESSNLLRRIRQFFKMEEPNQVNFICVTRAGTSSTGTSSSSSTPLVLISRPKINTSPIGSTDSSISTNNEENLDIINNQENLDTNTETSLFVYKDDSDAIPIEAFEEYVNKMHIDGDFGFAQLYEEITNVTKAYSFSSDVSLYDCNRCKNRYSNILTYEHSRVKLSHNERDESYGYINANYVDGYQKPNAYIATQGPMPNTFADFWRMILEKNCSIIVMITNVKEKGRIKCDQYWPDEGFEFYGNIQVTHLHTLIYAFYTKRIFTIKIKNSKKRQGVERLVYQYHFTDWPDHGVPYYILPVLSFIKKSSRSNPEFGGPIVVHCSAGVGRTGTYIVIDAMMKQIKHKSTVNIHNFLKHIRHQRNYLVQTEEQFIFIYDVLLESDKSGETELNEKNIKTYINNLNTPVDRSGMKLIDRQFELIVEFKPKDFQISAANMEYNLEKNRNQKIIPVNNSRVVLSRKPGIDGSEYINATYLNGCNRQDEFIVTQYPMEKTKSSFWQMVWDNNSNQIVVLNSDETEDCEPYWLPIGEAMKCDSFTVILREENFDMDFAVRDFLLQSIDEDYEFTCRMITASYWPDSCTPIKTAFDLINKVKQFRVQMTNNNTNNNTLSSNFANYSSNLSPVVVHDLLGGHQAATFCALYTFQDLIQLENSCNVYEIAKMYHLKRPNIWFNKSDIRILYDAVESLFDEVNGSNQYKFKNYLNMNIENHFNFMYNQSMSLANLPTNTNGPVLNPTQSTATLPNKFCQKNYNEAIGSKLHGFNKSESHDQVVKTPVKERVVNSQGKSILDNLPQYFPFFQSNNENRPGRTRANFGTKRARKFVNTMMLKSATFRKALFPLINGNAKSGENVKEEIAQDVEIRTGVKDQKPSVVVTLSSECTASSSAAGSSTSTFGVSTIAFTTNETLSLTNKTNNPISKASSNININKIPSTSKNNSAEKLN